MKTVYNKLVRNKIVPLMQQAGKNPVYKTITDDEEFIAFLIIKLAEEVTELNSAIVKGDKENVCEELADVLEVLDTIAVMHKISFDQMEYTRLQKYYKKGGFSMRTYLEEVEE